MSGSQRLVIGVSQMVQEFIFEHFFDTVNINCDFKVFIVFAGAYQEVLFLKTL